MTADPAGSCWLPGAAAAALRGSAGHRTGLKLQKMVQENVETKIDTNIKTITRYSLLNFRPRELGDGLGEDRGRGRMLPASIYPVTLE
ncbi:hypothetical protein NDU88_005787 [Pleurodeles waltl]|uniref:Uncharacterized protein n=1 Tax=Pleurodeles waltl TaxID=8319 RepID=A0AAV7MXG1_PLEWA|nr:hypothetical protein NDU88_005787 [Pleurodeles waltl]